MRVTITIDTDNAAFEDSPENEVRWILNQLSALLVSHGLTNRPLKDSNGNTVGRVTVAENEGGDE